MEEIKETLKEENHRIQKLYGYHDDGSLFVANNLAITTANMEKHKAMFQESIPESYMHFHKQVVSTASFSWHINSIDLEKGVFAYASSQILIFDSMLETLQQFINVEHKWYRDSGETHLLNFMRKGYYCINYKLGGPYILIKFKEQTYELFLLLEDGSLNKISVSLEEYFDLMCKTRGMFLWQAYITDNFPSSLLSKEYDGFFENMEYLFPEVDLSLFKHRNLINPEKSAASICRKYNYKEQFHNVVESLPQNITYHKVNSNCTLAYSPAGLQPIRNIESHLGLELPEALKAFYWQMDGFSVKWTANETNYNENYQMANFRIASLHDMFGGIIYDRIKEAHFNNAAKTYGLENSKNLKDKYVFYTDSYCHLLLEFTGKGKLKIWLHHLESDTREIDLVLIGDDFDRVLNLLLKSRGMFWWCFFNTKNSSQQELYNYFLLNTKQLFFEDLE